VYCTECGTSLSVSAKFCLSCGTATSENHAVNTLNIQGEKRRKQSLEKIEAPTQSSNQLASFFFFFMIIALLWFTFAEEGRGLSDPYWFDGSWYERATADCPEEGHNSGVVETIARACRNGKVTAQSVLLFTIPAIAICVVSLIRLNTGESNPDKYPTLRGGPPSVDGFDKRKAILTLIFSFGIIFGFILLLMLKSLLLTSG
jgi:hypothetical protein